MFCWSHQTQHSNVELSVAEIKGNVDYTASEYLKSAIVAHVTEQMGAVTLVVIKGAEISSIDATVALVSNRTHSKFSPPYSLFTLSLLQSIVSLCEDLKLLHCDLICWNWNLAAAGVVYRLQEKTRSMFKFTKTFSELIETMVTNGGSNNNSRRVSQIAWELPRWFR